MVVYQLLLDVVWHSRQRVVGACATGSLIVWVKCWSMLEQQDGTGESGDWFRCLRETAAACQRHWLHVPQAPWDFVIQFRDSYCFNWCLDHTSYLSFFLHEQNFWKIEFTPKKRENYDKIHSKLPFFCIIKAKYTVNCQFFALNL